MADKYRDDIPNTEQDYLVYLDRLTSEGGNFVCSLFELRKKYKIPEMGFISNYDNRGVDYPEEWTYSADSIQKQLLDSELEKLAEKYRFPPRQWVFTLRWLLFFNVVAKNPDQQLGTVLVLATNEAALYAATHPVVLALGPNISKTKLEDYVEKCFVEKIKPTLDAYATKGNLVGTLRAGSYAAANRRRIIQSYSHLPRKQIARIIQERHGIIEDEGNIGKIISLGKMEDRIDFEN